MKRKKRIIKSLISLLVVTILSVGSIGLAGYYPRMEEEKLEKEQIESNEYGLSEGGHDKVYGEYDFTEGKYDKRYGEYDVIEDGCLGKCMEYECKVDEGVGIEYPVVIGESNFFEEGEYFEQRLGSLPEWNTVLQRRDWMHSSGPGFNNLFPWNDNHAPRAVFPVSPIVPSGNIITLGEMFEHFWHCPERRNNPLASHFRPGSEEEQRIAFRVWHATPGQRYHIDLTEGSAELFPLSRWQTPHFQYAYVQYLHFNLNFCGNGLPSDVNHGFTRMNIMGSHYDRMFVYSGAGAGWEGRDARYETLRNHLFPVSQNCEIVQPHPDMSGVQPVYDNLEHPNGYTFGGWFRTLAHANNHESEEGRMLERTERVSTDLSRTLYARWIPTNLEIPCEACDEELCVCEEGLCEECERESCICEEIICEECGRESCICEVVVCGECDRESCICEEDLREVCDRDLCNHEEGLCEACDRELCLCEEGLCEACDRELCLCEEVLCEACDRELCICEEVLCNECERCLCDCESCPCEEECDNGETECEVCNSNRGGATNPSGNSNSSRNSNSPQTGDDLRNLVEAIALLATSSALIVGLVWFKRRDGIKA